MAAWREYNAGMTLLALGERYWLDWGYKNAMSAVGAISACFRARCLPVRSHKEGIALGFARPGGRPNTTGPGSRGYPVRSVAARASDRARAEFRRREQEELQTALRDPTLALLLSEQARDMRLGHLAFRRGNEVSIDEPVQTSDGEIALRIDLLAHTPDFSSILIERMDVRREIDLWALDP